MGGILYTILIGAVIGALARLIAGCRPDGMDPDDPARHRRRLCGQLAGPDDRDRRRHARLLPFDRLRDRLPFVYEALRKKKA